MKTQSEEIDAKERLPAPGRLVEVESPTTGKGWFKCRLIKGGQYPLWQSLDFPGTLGSVNRWKEVK